MQGFARTRGRSPVAELLLPRRHKRLAAPLTLLICCLLLLPAITAQDEEERSSVVPLNGSGGSSSSTGIIIGSVVAILAVMLITGLVGLLCMLHHRRRLRYGRGHVYTDADSISFQDDRGHAPRHRGTAAAANASPREGTETGGLYSQRTVEPNEPVTQPPMRGQGDNYADRFECRSDDGVRPASPNAERVEGVAIENRIRPRRHLPRGQVVIHHDNQDVCLDFRGVERVPQAGPPPLTEEEKQRIIDAQNRVASPEFYGRAEYEHRRASDSNTPNVLLSSSLLRELQQQYAAASLSGHMFPSYASDAGHSIESMSFRPGSPAGSARRGRRDGRQSTSPTSVTVGRQSLRHRKSGSHNHTNSREASGRHQHASIPRQYHDDLESTSDDFEDLSLRNESFTGLRERLRDVTSHPLRSSSGLPVLGTSVGVDQLSLRSNSTGAFERYMSATGSVNGGTCLNISMVSGHGMRSPLDHPQDSPEAAAHAPHSLQSTQHTPLISPVLLSTAARGTPHPAFTTVPAVSGGSTYKEDLRKSTAGLRNAVTTTISNASTQSSKSSTVSPGMLPALPTLPPTHHPPGPSNALIQVLGMPQDASLRYAGRCGSEAADQQKQQLHSTPTAAVFSTPALSLHSGAAAASELDSRAAVSGGGMSARYLDASLGLHSRLSTPSKSDQLPSPVDVKGALSHSGDVQRVQVAQTALWAVEIGNGDLRDSVAPLLLPHNEEGEPDGASRGHSSHSKSD
ncbi:hypothetical protein ABL78_8084 [Leptomonas seymouri]|uniref:Uncharacterized protein n=1 Tax=Leptomonas seymouri TaxID=5684 RepID=A0A0N1HYM8_LEPSE|nr:hypothetical protein ABL78_8084 [Leptomonas seymouri]|eukprot:KPI82905.1 hypothetical protein ABL78_8084 [Leptomonas seymouri]